MKYELPHFSEVIDIKKLKSYYNGYSEDKDVDITLSFSVEEIDKKDMNKVKSFLSKIDKFHKKNMRFFYDSIEDNNTDITDHLESIIESIVDNDVLSRFGLKNSKTTNKENQKKLIDNIQFKALHIHPLEDKESEIEYAFFDYKVISEIDDILVLRTDEKGKVINVSIES